MGVIENVKKEINKNVIGHENLIDSMLICLFADGHLLVESVPGLAKTTAINTLSLVVDLTFKRIQFTSDITPTDIIGEEIFSLDGQTSHIIKGPIFTNLLLADEINRAPAKVQSALLEVMQEKQVTIGYNTYKLENPFLVLATQNPISNTETYELPQAQLDRFMFKINLDYNTIEEEAKIIDNVVFYKNKKINKILDKNTLLSIQRKINDIEISVEIKQIILELVFATRYPKKYNLKTLEKYIKFGVSPRASIDMYKVVKANAFIKNRFNATYEDILDVIHNVFDHRIVLTKLAIDNGITTFDITDKILKSFNIEV